MRPILLALLLSAPAFAQDDPAAPMLRGDTSRSVATGTYHVEPYHTQVIFAVSHLGVSPYAGWFSEASGSLSLDAANPAASMVSITLPIASVTTASAKLTEELKSADWFDAARFPTARFTSTRVRVAGTGAAIDGDLTLHGVTKPVTIRARLFGSGLNPMSKAANVGFVAKFYIKRSDFGVSKYIPLVSDDVELVINAAFEKDPAPAPTQK